MNTDAYNAAIRRLSTREYSSHELAAYLKRKGFSREDIAEVIAALVSRKFLDDSRYAKAMTRYQVGRGKGPTYIRSKLMQKGVKLEASKVNDLVNEVSEKSQLEVAREIVERKYPNFAADRAIASKAFQALVRRGFGFEIARQATDRRLADHSFAEEE